MKESRLKLCFEKSLKSLSRIAIRVSLLLGLVLNLTLQSECSQVFYEHFDYSGYYFYNYFMVSSTILSYPLFFVMKMLFCILCSNKLFEPRVKKNNGVGKKDDSSKIKHMTLHRIKRIFLGSLFLAPTFGFLNYFYLSALDLVQVSVVQTFQQVSGIFIIVLALLTCLRKERQFLCIKSMLVVVSLMGVSLISVFSYTQKNERFPNAWLGVIFLVIQNLFLALYQVLYVKFFEDLNIEEVFLFQSFNGFIYMTFFWPPILIFNAIGWEAFQMSGPILIFNLILGGLGICFGVNLAMILNFAKAPLFAGLSSQLSTVVCVTIDSIFRKVWIPPLVILGIFIVLVGSFSLNLVYTLPERWNCLFGKYATSRILRSIDPRLGGVDGYEKNDENIGKADLHTESIESDYDPFGSDKSDVDGPIN